MEVLESLHGNVVCALAAGIGDYVRCTLEPMLFEVPGFDEYSENLIKSSMIGVRKISFGKESVAETREIPYNNAV